MRLKINKFATWEEEMAYQDNWHPWFAWHPVCVGNSKLVWLESIERRCTLRTCEYGDSFEYREVTTA